MSSMCICGRIDPDTRHLNGLRIPNPSCPLHSPRDKQEAVDHLLQRYTSHMGADVAELVKAWQDVRGKMNAIPFSRFVRIMAKDSLGSLREAAQRLLGNRPAPSPTEAA